MKNRKRESGFIALSSVLIIGAVIIVLGVSIFYASLTDQSISMTYESGQEAAFLADFCLKEGILRLEEDIDYKGGEEIEVGDKTCYIGLVENIDGNTKKVSSLGRAGERSNFSRASQLVNYVIESSASDWIVDEEGEELSNLDIVGASLKLKQSAEIEISTTTDSLDDWNNITTWENVGVEDGSLVLSSVPTPPPTCASEANGSCKADCLSFIDCSPALGGNYDCSGVTPYCCVGTCSPTCASAVVNGSCKATACSKYTNCNQAAQNYDCSGVTPYCCVGTCSPTCASEANGSCKADCSVLIDCSPALGGNYNCSGATPYCCVGTCRPFGCVIADTLIITPSGYKKIQDLNVEDEVIGFDIEKNERVVTEVKTKSIHTGLFPAWVYNGITFTWNHKVYVNNQWQYVAELAEKVGVFEGTVYNITTQTQNYFGKYGDSGIETLIHNKPIPQ